MDSDTLVETVSKRCEDVIAPSFFTILLSDINEHELQLAIERLSKLGIHLYEDLKGKTARVVILGPILVRDDYDYDTDELEKKIKKDITYVWADMRNGDFRLTYPFKIPLFVIRKIQTDLPRTIISEVRVSRGHTYLTVQLNDK